MVDAPRQEIVDAMYEYLVSEDRKRELEGTGDIILRLFENPPTRVFELGATPEEVAASLSPALEMMVAEMDVRELVDDALNGYRGNDDG